MLCSKHLTSEACRSTLPCARWYAAGRGTTVSPPQPVIHRHPAPRLQISLIKLPGEAQKIDRIIEQFAINYVEANPTAVDHVDTAQIIAFSLVMLNTDAHNDAIKKVSAGAVDDGVVWIEERKMTLQQYTRNLRGICKDGSSPDQVALEGYFERVVRYEWQVEERRYMQHVCEGWLYKTSRSMVNASPRRMYRPQGRAFQALQFHLQRRVGARCAQLGNRRQGVHDGGRQWRRDGAVDAKLHPQLSEDPSDEHSDAYGVKQDEPDAFIHP
ncbi:MAG: hypothetical protein SGPRY_011042 [Prymnesium sp.]